jgi:hypothetical protein
MAVRVLRGQEAQHNFGAILRSAGREAMQFELGGKVITIDVERGIGSDLFYFRPPFDGTTAPRSPPTSPSRSGRSSAHGVAELRTNQYAGERSRPHGLIRSESGTSAVRLSRPPRNRDQKKSCHRRSVRPM